MKKIYFTILLFISFIIPVMAQNGGYALKFDGTDGKVSTTLNTGLTNSTITLEMWVCQVTAQSGTQFIADLHSISGINRRRVMPYFNTSEFGVYCAPNTGDDNNAVTQLTGVTVSAGVWNHIAITVSGSTLKMYVNGKLYITASLTDSYALTGTEILTLADDYWDTSFANIIIDEVRFWNTVRTEAEIKANMFKELAGSESGLVMYNKMSNGSGTTLTDNQTSGSYSGTLSGGASWVASGAFADSRNALDFDGSNDYINCGNGANVQFNGTASLTVEAWIKPTGGVWCAIVSKFIHSSSGEGYSLEIFSDNRVSILFGNNWSDWTALTSGSAISTGVWHHIAATYDGSTLKIYVDGYLAGSGSWTNGITDAGGPLYIGCRDGSTFMNGQIDEVRIWRTARTVTEIRENMCKTLTGSETGLAAYYRLDQIDGTTAYDITSNAYNGTLTNMDASTDWIASNAFNVWLGTNSSTWTNGGNWSKGSAPTSSQSVGIYKWALGSEAAISSSPTVNTFVISSTASPTLSSSLTVNYNLILEKNFDLNGNDITLGSTGYLIEGTGRLFGTSGTISTTRSLSSISSLDVALLGAKITTSANMGSTTITRGHAVQTGNGQSSIQRYYDITPTNNSSLNASVYFYYNENELNSISESNLILFRSTDSGSTWTNQAGTVSTANNYVYKTGIGSFSRWTFGSSAASLAGPPDTPTASAASSITATSFSANWSASTGATKYYLDVSTDNGFEVFVSGFENLDVGNVITYSVTGLTPGTTYYYKVRAYNASGTSSSSDSIVVITTIAAPVASAATSINSTGFNANWSASTGAAGYYLDVSANSGFTSIVTGYNNLDVGNVVTYSVSGLSGGATYYYRVRAYTASVTSSNSGTITVLTTPAAPVAKSASNVQEARFTANWSPVTGATAYYLDVATDLEFTTFVTGYENYNAGADTSKTVTGINSNTTYYYRVRAYNASGPSANSNVIYFNTLAESPVLSNLETAGINYTVKQSTVLLTDSLVVVSPESTPVQRGEISVSQNYVKGEDELLFVNPENLTVSWNADTGQIIITGSASETVYQAFIRTVKYKNNSITPSSLNKTISYVVNNGFYSSNTVSRSITISSGNVKPQINKLESATLTYLKGVSALRIGLTDSSEVTDADSYFMYSGTVKISEGYIKGEYYIDYENTTFISGSYNEETGILSITGTETAANYQMFLRSLQYRNRNGSSGTSSQKIIEFAVNDGLLNSTAVTRALIVKSPVETPTNLTAAIVSNAVKLSWTDNSSSEDGFIIERSEGNNTLYSELTRAGSNTVTYSDANIVNGKKYYYRIAAYDGTLTSDYSNEVNITGIVVGISDMNGKPTAYTLAQNYPNPFNPSTVIVFALPYESKVKVEIYNSIGQLIETLADDIRSAGYYKITWNASKYASGIYLCRVTAFSVDNQNKFIESKRMILMK